MHVHYAPMQRPPPKAHLFICPFNFLILSFKLFQALLVPLAGTVKGLLEVVLHHCGIARAVEADSAGL